MAGDYSLPGVRGGNLLRGALRNLKACSDSTKHSVQAPRVWILSIDSSGCADQRKD
nr:hypothetical protein [uncultured Pseudomonas sp.]